MPQVGPVGQRKLMDAKVLIIGAGGLGSPVALYLALAGVGTIGIVDFDVVDLSNLQRQILHQTRRRRQAEGRVGAGDAARLQPGRQRRHPRGAAHLRQRDGDHLAVRHHRERRGQLRDALPGERRRATSPRSRWSTARSCSSTARRPCTCPARAATAASTRRRRRPAWCRAAPRPACWALSRASIGSIQATEVLKLILGIGEPLVGRLLLYDALAMEFRTVKRPPRPELPALRRQPDDHGADRLRRVSAASPFPSAHEKRSDVLMAVEVRVTGDTAEARRRQEGRRGARAATVGEVLDDVDARYPGFKEQVVEDGQLHRFVNIYLNDEDIRFLAAARDAAERGRRASRSCPRWPAAPDARRPRCRVMLYRSHPRHHRQYAARRAAASSRPKPERAALRQARGAEPHRQRQGPHRAVHDRGGGGDGRADARQDHPRADQRQHRHQPGDGLPRQGLPAPRA